MNLTQRAELPWEKRMVLSRLQALWDHYPKMRLTQLIENARGRDKGTLPADTGIFYNMEDFDFIRELEKFYDNLERENAGLGIDESLYSR